MTDYWNSQESRQGVMMEYSCFDFGPFGVEKKGVFVEDFVHFVDDEYDFCDFSSFADVLVVCERDVVTGLEILHRSGIAHCDERSLN